MTDAELQEMRRLMSVINSSLDDIITMLDAYEARTNEMVDALRRLAEAEIQ